MNQNKISIIFPVFNEEGNLQELYQRLVETVSSIRDKEFEFIFVDDCSTDKSHQILEGLYHKDSRVVVIRFARNCGSHAAIAYGLRHCKGQAAIVLAADLQDPPALIHQLLQEWQKGAKVVWGARVKREGEKVLTNIFSKLYYRLMCWLTNIKMPPLGADVFLSDRVVLDAFKEMTEKHSSVFMAISWLGFKQVSIEYVKEARGSGVSKWTLGKKLKLMVDSLLTFSDIPIRYMSVLGLGTAFLGFLYALVVLWCFINGLPVRGWSSLIIVILVMGGVQMIMLGVLGEYLWRTYDESRRRPRYVIEAILDKNHKG